MEFLKSYKQKMDQFNEKYIEARNEIDELKSTVSLLDADYQKAVEEMDFDKASALYSKLEAIKNEIKVKTQIAGVIKARSLSCDEKDFNKILKEFDKFKAKKMKEKEALLKHIEEKKAEYVEAVKDTKLHNEEVLHAVQKMYNIPFKRKPETTNEIMYFQQNGEIKINTLIIQHRDLQ